MLSEIMIGAGGVAAVLGEGVVFFLNNRMIPEMSKSSKPNPNRKKAPRAQLMISQPSRPKMLGIIGNAHADEMSTAKEMIRSLFFFSGDAPLAWNSESSLECSMSLTQANRT